MSIIENKEAPEGYTKVTINVTDSLSRAWQAAQILYPTLNIPKAHLNASLETFQKIVQGTSGDKKLISLDPETGEYTELVLPWQNNEGPDSETGSE